MNEKFTIRPKIEPNPTLKEISEEIKRLLNSRSKINTTPKKKHTHFHKDRFQNLGKSCRSVISLKPHTANLVPKSKMMTPMKWGNSPFKEKNHFSPPASKLSENNENGISELFSELHILENFLSFLSYDELAKIRIILPFCYKKRKYEFIIRRFAVLRLFQNKVTKEQRIQINTQKAQKIKETIKNKYPPNYYLKMCLKENKIDTALIQLDVKRTIGISPYNSMYFY